MKYFLMSVCLLFLFDGYAQEKTIPYIDSQIKVDGQLTEDVWAGIPAITGFYNYIPTDIGLAEHQNVVRLFHNGEYLFIGVVYQDSESRIQTNSLKRDASIGLSDSFVIIFDTQNQQQNAYYFAVNGYGTQVDGLVERVNEGFDFSLSWNTIWKAATSVRETDKVYEFAIPLKSLNYHEQSTTFGIQMYNRDIKKNAWSIMSNVKRNYRLFDLRFTTPFKIDNLPDKAASRFAFTPSLTVNHQRDLSNSEHSTTTRVSGDLQYNVTSSLKLDATINPDFSQIDVDQQVTNLTRFAVFFPERRNFFLENSDLFSNLGVDGVNPFYSRRIGAANDIQFGLKLSGNIAPKTRIGVLNVQTNTKEEMASQNYSTFVAEQQITKNFTATGFFINRQETDKAEFVNDYNRVAGLNVNFKSNNNRWIGLANAAKSMNDDLSGEDNFYHAGIWYNQRGFSWEASIKTLGENYLSDVGFTPRLFNYDAINDEVVREGYTETVAGVSYQRFYENSKTINSFRVINYSNNQYYDRHGNVTQSTHFLNSALFFKNLSSIYYVVNYDIVNLEYGFDPLGNGNAMRPDLYRFALLKVGYNSANNQKVRYRLNVQRGQYYGGERRTAGGFLNYQLLPFANIQLSYDLNEIDLNELGKETFHLARFTGEVFFNTRLNWTTYVQFNTQRDNFNVNSRLQWEYKPLSYLFLVVTDNFNQTLNRTNWGVALKVNYRFDF
ncbi:MAG: DUF5916 domain-containing protein [Bacteroidota bacterium]